jgi:NAD(P)-dependent dehydrogenase (short-subunit alcohol dehydrogenase family)
MIYDLFKLNDKVAIVTGASRGIGKNIALTLGEAGANVVLAATKFDLLKQVADQMIEKGQRALPIRTDVTKKDEVDRLVQETLKEFGRIDILVNCAGIYVEIPAEDFPEKVWDDVINVNLKGVFLCCQAVGREMIKQKKGKIVNISSINSVIVEDNICAYDSSKGGVKQLTKSLAYTWAKYNINVNAIGPGDFKTEMTRVHWENEVDNQIVINSIPFRRWGDPEKDFAGVIIFLTSEASDYITGHEIHLDGGRLLH